MNDAPDKTERHDPLRGIKVVDFTIVMSGPMCTRYLADAGADVVKIEAPAGDIIRQRPPMKNGHGTYFSALNCGKRSVVLDLQTEEGRAIARELALGADVLVENFRPGVMRRLGLDHDSLAKDNPRLIYCSLSGFGQRGPASQSPAYAPVIHAASGYEQAHMSYQRGSEKPANNGIFIADVLGAVHATSAINMALFDRERTGVGQAIDLALMDSMLAMLVYEVQAAQVDLPSRRQVYEPVRARDGYVMVAAVTPKNLESLFDAIGFPEGKTDERFSSVSKKEANWSALLDIVERWTSERSAMECERTLLAAGVPCSRYRTVGEAMADPQVSERGLLKRIGEGDESFLVVNPPYSMSRARVEARPQVAALGEHTAEVLASLGYESSEIDDLRERGVLGHAPTRRSRA
jgi:CoA:oxalate CoA-transferase